MANLFLPQIITWFRLDEHVKRLKSILDSLIDRVTVLEETPTPVFTSPYKVYSALLTQFGTNPPVATVLENTLGDTLVWSYNIQGVYFADTLLGTHIFSNPNKVAICPIANTDNNLDGTTLGLNYAIVNDANTILVASVKNGVGLENNLLNNHLIEIRVYN